MKAQYDLFINGKFVKPQSKQYYDTINPATEKKIASIAKGNAKDIDLAVKSAKKHSNLGPKQNRKKEQNIFTVSLA